MHASTHRIRRQVWQVRTRSQPDAFAARQCLRRELSGGLMSAFETACDVVAPGETMVHIARLELVLRIGSIAQMGDLADLLRRQLVERLQQALGGAHAPAAVRLDDEKRRQALLRGYLKSGEVAWPWRPLDQVEPELAAEAGARRQLELAVAEGLARALALAPPGATLDEARVAFFFRVLELCAEVHWPDVARTAAGAAVTAGQAAAGAIAAVGAASASGLPQLRRYARLQLGATVLALVASPEATVAPGTLALAVGRALLVTARAEPAALLARLPPALAAFFALRLPGGVAGHDSPGGAAPGPAGVSATRAPSGLEPHLTDPGPIWPAPVPTDTIGPAASGAPAPPAAVEANRPGAAPTARPGLPVEAAPAPPSLAAVLAPRGALAPAGEVVSHAGLVLLHPFVPRLFEATGLADPAARTLEPLRLPRAAALLHFLATGTTEASEVGLGFIKPLLGLPITHPLPIAEGLLASGDRDEAEALLAAVLGHWAALKGTTSEGLRGSFLQRPGLLREDDRALHLQVRPASFDVLLGRLPWGISVFKWSWMEKPVFTEWTAP